MSMMPQGDDLKKAVAWITEMLQEKTKKSMSDLICDASRKFDLKPLDEEFLMRNFCKKQ